MVGLPLTPPPVTAAAEPWLVRLEAVLTLRAHLA
jgi:hypothetical protein